MKLRKTVFLLLAVTLPSCQRALYVGVINDLNVPIILSTGNFTVSVPPGERARIRYPDPDGHVVGSLRIETASCIFSYMMPKTLSTYHWMATAEDTLPLQIEQNYKLYAVPPDAVKPVSIGSIAMFEKYPFPLEPTERKCS